MKKLTWLALVAGIALIPGSARAETTLIASMTHDQEVANPPVPAQGSYGFAVFTLSDDMTSLKYHLQLTGLDLGGQTAPTNDNVTRIHIHRAPVGTNGGIVYGMIDGSAALRNDPDDLVVNAAAGTISGVWDGLEGANGATLAGELANLLNRGLYFNVHTADHGGGEIRGQIRAVPEPSSIVLGGLGVVAFGWAARRARRRRG